MASPLAIDQTMVSPLAAQNAPAGAQAQTPAPVAPAPSPDMANFNAAMQQMKLNPQEQSLYQMHLQNLHGPGGVDNADGSRSTLYQITAEIGGKTYVLPTVWNGQILQPEQAVQMARQYGLDKFPTYATEDEAEARYQKMHDYMEKDTAAYLKGRK
jgi:hypothetical protein